MPQSLRRIASVAVPMLTLVLTACGDVSRINEPTAVPTLDPSEPSGLSSGSVTIEISGQHGLPGHRFEAALPDPQRNSLSADSIDAGISMVAAKLRERGVPTRGAAKLLELADRLSQVRGLRAKHQVLATWAASKNVHTTSGALVRC